MSPQSGAPPLTFPWEAPLLARALLAGGSPLAPGADPPSPQGCSQALRGSGRLASARGADWPGPSAFSSFVNSTCDIRNAPSRKKQVACRPKKPPNHHFVRKEGIYLTDTCHISMCITYMQNIKPAGEPAEKLIQIWHGQIEKDQCFIFVYKDTLYQCRLQHKRKGFFFFFFFFFWKTNIKVSIFPKVSKL